MCVFHHSIYRLACKSDGPRWVARIGNKATITIGVFEGQSKGSAQLVRRAASTISGDQEKRRIGHAAGTKHPTNFFHIVCNLVFEEMRED